MTVPTTREYNFYQGADKPFYVSLRIAAGQSYSDIYYIGEHFYNPVLPVGVRIPAQWTLAPITFSGWAYNQQGNYFLYDDSGLYTLYSPQVKADIYVAINCPFLFLGLDRIQVHCGTDDSPIYQIAERYVELHLRATRP